MLRYSKWPVQWLCHVSFLVEHFPLAYELRGSGYLSAMYLWRFGEGKRMGRKFTQWISSLLPHSLAEEPGWSVPGVFQLLLSLAVSVGFQATAFQFTGCKHSPDLIVLADS